MPARADSFDLAGLRLSAGEGRRLDLDVTVDPFLLGRQRYRVEPNPVAVQLEISRTTADGYALRLRFDANVTGPCMRCLDPAAPSFAVEAREVSQPGGGDELDSPYVEHGVLDIRAWVRDALALSLPASLLCKPDCAGLCSVCGENLNLAGSEHHHERAADPRWAKLSELRFDA